MAKRTSNTDHISPPKSIKKAKVKDNPYPLFTLTLENVVIRANQLMEKDALDLNNKAYGNKNQISRESWSRLFVPMPTYEDIMKPKTVGKPVKPSDFESELLALVELVEQQANLNDDLSGLFNPDESLPDIPPNDRFYLSDNFKEEQNQRIKDEQLAAELEGRPVRNQIDDFPIVVEPAAPKPAPDILMSLLNDYKLPRPPALKTAKGNDNDSQSSLDVSITEIQGTPRKRGRKKKAQSRHVATPPNKNSASNNSFQSPSEKAASPVGSKTSPHKLTTATPSQTATSKPKVSRKSASNASDDMNASFQFSPEKSASPVKPKTPAKKITTAVPSQTAPSKPTVSGLQKPGQITPKPNVKSKISPLKTDTKTVSKPVSKTGGIPKKVETKPTAKRISLGLPVKTALKTHIKTLPIAVPLSKTSTSPKTVEFTVPEVSTRRGRPPGSPNKKKDNSPNKVYTKTPLKATIKAKTPAKTSAKTPAKTSTKTPAKTSVKTPAKTPAKSPTKIPAKTPVKTPAIPPVKVPSKSPPKTTTKTVSKTVAKPPRKSLAKAPSTKPNK